MRAALAAAALVLAAPAAAQTHVELRVILEPEAGTVAGEARYDGLPGIPRSFRLADGLVADRVAIGGIAVPARLEGATWRLDPPGDAKGALSIAWHGRPRAPAGAPPPIAAEGTLLAGGAGWYPAIDGLVATWNLRIDLPESQRAAATGRLVGDTVEAGRRVARFALARPESEVSAFAGPYAVSERAHGALRLATYFPAHLADLADTYLSKTAHYIDLYRDWIGDYPYDGFSVVASPRPVGFGFAGLTLIGEAVLRLPFIPDTSLGHEVLHSWWGNAVRVDYARGNWCEGLTTFMADHFYAERRDGAHARAMRLGWLRDFAGLPAARDRPVREFISKTHGASQVIGYHKAAMIFVMLREEIGRDAFDAGIRAFWRRERFRTAAWDDLAAAFGEAAGRDLVPFFRQWLDRAGAPRLSVELGAVEPGRVRFTLRQDADYDLRVPVRIDADQGAAVHALRLAGPAREFAVEVRGTPRALTVDPEATLFRRLLPGEVPAILRHVALDLATRTAVADDAEPALSAARALAGALLEAGLRPIEPDDPAARTAPLLIVGTAARVMPLLERLAIRPPDMLPAEATANAWAASRRGAPPVLVVMGKDGAALAAIARPLPHYGAASWVAFEGSRQIGRGVWEAAETPLRVTLER